MAELAIPIVLLGGMYVISNQSKKNKGNEISSDSANKYQEGMVGNMPSHVSSFDAKVNEMKAATEADMKQNMAQQSYQNQNPVVVLPPVSTNAHTRTSGSQSGHCGRLADCNSQNINVYDGGEDRRQKYYDKDVYRSGVRTNGGGHKKLTGEEITPNNFRHNNMVPFFGSKIRGTHPNANVHEGLLDSMQGTGSLKVEKREVGNFFKNQEGFANIHGSKNHNDFYMQRMVPSMRMDHITPFETQKVGPGAENANFQDEFSKQGLSGFNTSMQLRDKSMPRTVDEMRASSMKKATGMEQIRAGGPMNQPIKKMGTVGKIEKRTPDSHFEYTPNMWSAGVSSGSLGPTQREKPGEKSQKLLHKNFDHGTQLIAGSSTVKNGSLERTYLPSNRLTGMNQVNPELEHMQITRANPDPTTIVDNDKHIKDGMTHKSTYRSVTYDEGYDDTFMGGVKGALKAFVAPIQHIIKPTQKEEIFVNHRNLNSYKQSVQKPESRDFEIMQSPTNREILEGSLGLSHVQSQPNQMGQSRVTQYKLKEESLHSHVGGAAGNRSSGAADNHHLNKYQASVDRTVPIDRMPLGNTNIYSPTMNARIEKQYGIQQEPRFEVGQGHIAIPSVHTFGVTNSMFSLSEKSNVEERLDSGLLDAFKQNPFTHSLQSVA